MSWRERLNLTDGQIADFCRQHHIKRMAVFGSILRDDWGPQSDVDVLVEVEPGHVPGFGFIAIGRRLGEVIGRPVDLSTFNGVHPYLRQEIYNTLEVIYDAA